MKVFQYFTGALILLSVFCFPFYLVSAAATNTTVNVLTACNDGIDNDGDSLIDFPADPGCSSAADNNEFNAVSPPPPSPPPSGGGTIIIPTTPAHRTGVEIHGISYPQSEVTVLKDGKIASIVTADNTGDFEYREVEMQPGNYNYSAYTRDRDGIRSSSVSVSVQINDQEISRYTHLFIPPTVRLLDNEVSRGEIVTVLGYSTALSEVSIFVSSESEQVLSFSTGINSQGMYSFPFTTEILKPGQYSLRSRSAARSRTSQLSNQLFFEVSEADVTEDIPVEPEPQPSEGDEIPPPAEEEKCPSAADLNSDCSVDLIDFSIAVFWYNRELSPEFLMTEAQALNGDGMLDMLDFSLIAYYWTG